MDSIMGAHTIAGGTHVVKKILSEISRMNYRILAYKATRSCYVSGQLRV